ncbi:tigger transposable element-derived protein 6-like protein [Elysia marginata]|uniref:Tigger transposable element-derived protein 6-like protein n=1 Tax=Elysia marginata TaxID=1093978 RepID=A0AAV4JE10_9GAST|nr:tigger transposable element-derived protein 6-like protein [Elysia marginata]
MTLYAASKHFHIHNVPLSTLGDKVRGRRAIKPQVKTLLTPEEEEKLVRWIKIHAQRSMGRTHDDVRDKVKEILALRGASVRREHGRPGKDWVTSFKKRHPGLSLRAPQALGKERALVQEEHVRQWFGAMKDYLDGKDPSLLKSPNRIFNADETGFALAPFSKRVLAPTGMRHVYATTQGVGMCLSCWRVCAISHHLSKKENAYYKLS